MSGGRRIIQVDDVSLEKFGMQLDQAQALNHKSPKTYSVPSTSWAYLHQVAKVWAMMEFLRINHEECRG